MQKCYNTDENIIYKVIHLNLQQKYHTANLFSLFCQKY